MTERHNLNATSLQMALAEARTASDGFGRDALGWREQRLQYEDRVIQRRPVPYADQVMRMRRRWIERKTRDLIDACSLICHCDTGESSLKPVAADLEYAVWILIQARDDKAGPGRPLSPKVNGPRLRELQKEAGMTQADLINGVNEHLCKTAALNLKSVQRYEQS